ncbi:MAG TPA: DNA internalization-related competence protein ComEC/Rec2 [Planctomycetota bacterium]|nr:DNA internalization-related competence protein ComEC/Rec2 [Planctomycetota bacterium]HQB00375.1 DNA internalization-related competence protein ComEC/Rec2 [Planctomycetota bacterium]
MIKKICDTVKKRWEGSTYKKNFKIFFIRFFDPILKLGAFLAPRKKILDRLFLLVENEWDYVKKPWQNVMSKPCVFFALFFIFGIVVGWHYQVTEWIVFLCLCFIVCLCWRWKIWLFLVIFFLGMWRVSWEYRKHPECKQPCLVKIVGVVTESPFPISWIQGQSDHERWYKNSFQIHAKSILQGNVWIDFPVGVNVVIEGYVELHIGDEIEIFGWLKELSPPKNLYELDHRSFQYSQGVHYNMFVKFTEHILVLKKNRSGIWYRLDVLRKQYAEWIFEKVDRKTAALVVALVLGFRISLDENILQDCIQTGVVHLLAISGMHISIVALFFYIFLQYSGLRYWLASLLVIVLCIVYAMLVGCQVSVVRATVLICVYVSSLLFVRTTSIENTLALAALLVLLWKPLEVFQPGFQLSWSACYSIIKIYSPNFVQSRSYIKSTWWQTILLYCHKSILLSLTIFWGTSLLTAYHFYSIHLLAFLGTMVLMPIIILLIFCTLLFLFTFFSYGWGGILLSFSLDFLSNIFFYIVSFFSILPGSALYWIPPLVSCVILFYFILIIYPCKNIWFWLIFSFVCLFSGHYFREKQVQCPEIFVFSIGNGSINYISLPENKHILYDCGSMIQGVGKRILIPFLANKGIRKLDAVILSHHDADHYNALDALVGKIFIERVYVNQAFFDSGQKLLQTLQQYGTKIVLAKDEEYLFSYLQFLDPGKYIQSRSNNEHSLFILVEGIKTSLLFTGDAEHVAWEEFLKNYHLTTVDYFQVPHHGSFVKNMEQVLKKIQPRQAFISSAQSFPSSTTLELYKQMNIPIQTTYEDHMLYFKIE